MHQSERIIGRFSGTEKGPLFICLGGIHGNEPAGVHAIARFFRELEAAPGLSFRGVALGLKGNLGALKRGTRFIRRDLNRIMTPETVAEIGEKSKTVLTEEWLELRELLDHIREEMEISRPDSLVLLDIHTTSADGGVFSIPADYPESLHLALHFHVPILKGMTAGLDGTSLSFFTPSYWGVPCRAVAFEAGQNDDPQSVMRAVAAIKNGLKAAGCIPEDGMPNPEDRLLLEYAEGLPTVSELVCVHHVHPGDGFSMRPGYVNFQAVAEGEHLADDQNGPVLAPAGGLILMPLYQSQGTNGFFLVRAVTS